MIQWSDSARQQKVVDWTWLRDAAGATALADDIAATGREIPGGGTAIYGAINFALHEFDTNGYDGRQVIDVSGDGRSDLLVPTTAARDRAVARGVAINGLVILGNEPGLFRYYRDNVIGGAAALAVPISGMVTWNSASISRRNASNSSSALSTSSMRSTGGLSF